MAKFVSKVFIMSNRCEKLNTYIASNNKNERIREIVIWFIEKIAEHTYTSIQLYYVEKKTPNSNNMYPHF